MWLKLWDRLFFFYLLLINGFFFFARCWLYQSIVRCLPDGITCVHEWIFFSISSCAVHFLLSLSHWFDCFSIKFTWLIDGYFREASLCHCGVLTFNYYHRNKSILCWRVRGSSSKDSQIFSRWPNKIIVK